MLTVVVRSQLTSRTHASVRHAVSVADGRGPAGRDAPPVGRMQRPPDVRGYDGDRPMRRRRATVPVDRPVRRHHVTAIRPRYLFIFFVLPLARIPSTLGRGSRAKVCVFVRVWGVGAIAKCLINRTTIFYVNFFQ